MNKNFQYKFFNLKLFKQTFRIMTPVNLLFLGIFLLITILNPIGDVIGYEHVTEKMVLTCFDTSDYYMFIYVIYVPVITLNTFSFLTKRNACDYYHSFPHTRQCLFISNLAAVLSWLIITLASNTIMTIIMYKIFSKYFIISVTNILIFTLSIFICSLLVIAAILIACSITGTLFTNIIVTGLILFLPRFIIYIICSMITQNHGMLITNKIHPLLSYDINMVFSTPVMLYRDMWSNFFNTSSILYTLLLALIYFIISFFLFKNRKSEVAGTPSSSKKMQTIIRITLGIPVSLICVATIFDNLIYDSGITATDIYSVIIGYIITFICIAVYELITSKKFKNLMRCVSSLVIIIVFNAILIFAMKYEYNSMINYTPDADEIEYVQLASTYNYDSFFDQAATKTKLKNKELIELVSQSLKNTAKSDSIFTRNNVTQLMFGIKSDMFIKYRWIAMTETEYDKFNYLLNESPEIKETYTNLPEYDSFSSHILIDDQINEESSELIYNTLRNELKNIDTNYFIDIMKQYYDGINLQLVTTLDNKKLDTFIPINNYMPETLKTYINTLNNSAFNKKEYKNTIKYIQSDLSKDEMSQDISYDINVTIFDNKTVKLKSNIWLSNYDIQNNTAPELKDIFINIMDDYDVAVDKNIPFDSLATTRGQSLTKVDITYSDYSTPAKAIYTSFTFYYMIDDSVIDTEYFKSFDN